MEFVVRIGWLKKEGQYWNPDGMSVETEGVYGSLGEAIKRYAEVDPRELWRQEYDCSSYKKALYDRGVYVELAQREDADSDVETWTIKQWTGDDAKIWDYNLDGWYQIVRENGYALAPTWCSCASDVDGLIDWLRNSDAVSCINGEIRYLGDGEEPELS